MRSGKSGTCKEAYLEHFAEAAVLRRDYPLSQYGRIPAGAVGMFMLQQAEIGFEMACKPGPLPCRSFRAAPPCSLAGLMGVSSEK